MIWAGVGFVFASLVFAISVVSMPMTLDLARPQKA